VTKELTLHQVSGNAGAVHGHKGTRRARALIMNRPRHQFLPHATLTQHQHRHAALGNLPDLAEEPMHHSTATDQAVKAALALGGPVDRDFTLQFPLLKQPPHHQQQVIHGQRLGQEFVRAGLECFNRLINGAEGRYQQKQRWVGLVAGKAQQRHAVFVRQAQVGQYKLWLPFLEQRNAAGTVIGDPDIVAFLFELFLKQFRQTAVIFHHQDAHTHRSDPPRTVLPASAR